MTATDAAPEELRSACPDVVAAGDDDRVDGVPARWVARPGSTVEVAAVMRASAALGLRVVARGTGTRLSWGAPPTALDLIVDTSRMNRVVEHAAGDLVVTVQAGMPLAELQRALARHRQRLALDSGTTVDGGGTVGGTIATGASGPLRYRFGGVRDLLIGVTVVLADGTVARSGGKVVKNVAGYDLGKLYTGSLGTLGIVTEAVFRLHPLPDAVRWVTLTTSAARTAAEAVAAVRAAQHDPAAIEVDRAEPGGPVTVGVALEGVAAGVDRRAGQVAELMRSAAQGAAGQGSAGGADTRVADRQPDWWGRPPGSEPGPVVQVTAEPAGLADLLARAPGALRGSAGVGVYLTAVQGEGLGERLAELRRIAAAHGGSAVLRYAPPELKAGVDVWGPVPALALMRRLKSEFDPQHRLAPGRFVGGL